ncbi:transcriptional regulator [Acidithiobacillus sp. CV18-2]|uniref:helix-turn-helix domain-containing protein n=1 Tax=Acidithiobacillus caldus TaxID=33059 RepID=UPI001C0798AF|nr:hypothetical protein [Acidithiobacillus caldus]MBU2755190.1 transcriptional regulator [Acidithiobacillus sp. CV18-3]MBU2756896.1 transcriptional regulator [Acidithiobacillus sp. BN09-2]MBU2778006.1 transcriptional regulator [Acidithiobacillus sp. CV18-2]MBU2799607.1 transcriptional regulator [Acidithiobacillus sp. VAN18-4]MBU2764444.1 transcriptional regulator [Acidithiobacillus caldus]
MFHYESIGLPNIWLANGYDTVETPYGKAVAIHDLNGLHQAIIDHLVHSLNPLTGPELRFLRKELGLSQKTLGDYLGRDAQSVALWEKRATSTRSMLMADRLLRLLAIEHSKGTAPVKDLLDYLRDADSKPEYTDRRIFEWQGQHWIDAA